MLSVCLVFLYIFLSAYIAGFLVLAVIGRVFGREGCRKRKVKPDAYVMAGLAAVTVYAQIFSLFYKVGLPHDGGFIPARVMEDCEGTVHKHKWKKEDILSYIVSFICLWNIQGNHSL